MPIIISQDHLGPSWGSSGGPQGVLGGFQTENTRNMGKYQKQEKEKVVRLNFINKSVYIYTPRPSGTLLGFLMGSQGGSRLRILANQDILGPSSWKSKMKARFILSLDHSIYIHTQMRKFITNRLQESVPTGEGSYDLGIGFLLFIISNSSAYKAPTQ